jgi:hypothetical protein
MVKGIFCVSTGVNQLHQKNKNTLLGCFLDSQHERGKHTRFQSASQQKRTKTV